MKTIIFNLLVALIILVLFWWLFFYIGWYSGYSDGERTGEVYKFSKKGLFWKSWEGEMYLGGVSRDSEGGLVLDKFRFSIPVSQESEKIELIEKLRECGQQRAICTIEYEEWFKGPIQQSTGYTVSGVKKK
ncbi:hypothetical protein CMI37_11575 [Candidatus Pacearchaeota archaeon]|nr:hypothetical protein [Candidatus Pacearchaeota archaeon]|tara:strand:- start:7473 stop:7865 length:393 start_codon:yes stop_codon:yes gene_type:complete